ncbi:MAG: class I SAM-dependent methyltransferase [Betaproteobacteria bacterium]
MMGIAKPAGSGAKGSLLNVGGGDRGVAIPPHFDGWQQTLLDLNPAADIVYDARKLREVVPAASCDAVYCSHNLEHYYPHEVPGLVHAFAEVLKPAGFAEIRVPDIGELIRHMATNDIDIGAKLYDSPAGPISAHDVFYGFGAEIRDSGKDYYAHKTGFSRVSLSAALFSGGFPVLCFAPPLSDWELHVFAFKQQPDDALLQRLGLSP